MFKTYSNNNKIIEAKEYWNSPLDKKKAVGDDQLKYEGTVKFSFNETWQLVEMVRFGFADEFKETFINRWDDCVDTIGARETVKTNYKYDNSDLLVEEDQYDKEGQVIYIDIYKYSDFDKVGNWCKQVSYSTSYTSTCKTTVWVTERKIEYY